MATVAVEVLRELELEGYAAVMRAFYAGAYDWVCGVGVLWRAWWHVLVEWALLLPRLQAPPTLLARLAGLIPRSAGEGGDSDQAAQHPERR